MSQPAEHCGHQPDHVTGQPTECVLRPGHNGSHADHNGMRWWMRQTPDRPGIEEMTSDQLDALYTRLDDYRDSRQRWMDAAFADRKVSNELAARLAEAEQRAEKAEAAVERVRAELDRISELPTVSTCDPCNSFSTGVRWTLRMIRENALDQHGQTPS
ncbi:hypothetical protein ACIQMY_25430 [Streptomyces sp. NPDC091368]|uniref:hypothetical protein n=1 Tax=Streptomyces sp. NPDC091368 TaxID=3365993 RepID=UPI003830C8A6